MDSRDLARDTSALKQEAVARVGWRILPVALLWICYLSLRPFELLWDGAEILRRLAAGIFDLDSRGIWPHALGAVVIGTLLGLLRGERSRGIPRSVAAVSLVGFGLILEVTQAAFAGRHPRGGDWIVYGIASVSAFLLTRAAVGRPGLRHWIEGNAGTLVRSLAAVFFVLLGAAVLHHEREVSFVNWDPGLPLVVGNERSWDRPWHGRILVLGIYAAAMGEETSRDLFRTPIESPAGEGLRRGLPAAALYRFGSMVDGEDGLVPDRSEDGPGIPLRIEPSPRPEGDVEGLALRSESRVGTDDASALVELLRSGSELSIEVRLCTDDLEQTGPARIVSNSIDPYLRNFTVAQELDTLVLRVRTPFNGKNGRRVEASWPDVFVDAEVHHLVVAYARGWARLAVDGSPRSAVPLLWSEPDVGWNPLSSRIATTLLLLLPIALLTSLGWEATATALRLPLGALAGSATIGIAQLTGNLWFETTWDGTLPLLAALIIPLLDAICAALRGTGRSP